jgi:virginiamycin B lyase
MLDREGRLWFGENRGDRIGMFDTKTEQFKEWPAPTPGSWPYDVTGDKNGEAWSCGEFTDTVQRLNPRTGEFVEYLLPRFTNIRGYSLTTRPHQLRSGWETITVRPSRSSNR